jgi:hypothetical protein
MRKMPEVGYDGRWGLLTGGFFVNFGGNCWIYKILFIFVRIT